MLEDPISGHFLEEDVVTPNYLCATCIGFTHAFRNYLEKSVNQITSTNVPSGKEEQKDLEDSKDSSADLASVSQIFPFHSNLRSLNTSFKNKCHLCTLFWLTILSPPLLAESAESLELDLIPNVMVEFPLYAASWNRSSWRQQRTSLEIQLSLVKANSGHMLSTGPLTLDLTFAKNPISDVPIDASFSEAKTDVKTSDTISVWTGSQPSLELAESWINDCVTNHEACRKSSHKIHSREFLPTRFVDVSSGTESLRLCRAPQKRSYTQTFVGEQHSDRQRREVLEYVTLSHAWGGADFVKLTTQNYARLFDRFSVHELPRTWQDAIRLTQSLGYRYIWIDALCIIQDSLYDWEIEAASMGQVYENCHLNIAALAVSRVPWVVADIQADFTFMLQLYGHRNIDKNGILNTCYATRGTWTTMFQLPAISGLAKLIATDIRCAYYAGIWQKWEIDDLLWCIKEPVTYNSETVNSDTEADGWSERGRQGDLYRIHSHQAGRETGNKYFPDRVEDSHAATHRASLAHLDLSDSYENLRVDFGLVLSASGNGVQGNTLYRRLGMYYDTFSDASYVKTRGGMYHHASVTLI
ncbi:TOL protein [Colletotrichum orchidophilum]|uniref:TOL protein n=1 Tax=Colletotrichum orchidophilum TaxID=1209926 RepID=A0A1G4BRV7_9PEZI|nr:TOL protein [Colletotrichum orchidophilum]OHF04179.1 TOL protein [Colletotrichum orchidophilum]